ncbi:prealbumin-like fold domain-containing protein, partial [Latilactobacillus graminis]|uniref:prealbumin-like fold domain-containing protein n=1 Tax=Latilactobacillus graminis TaxID=60519 RepID=UPI00138ED0EA
SAEATDTKYGKQYELKYSQTALAGAEFDIKATADIYAADGTLKAKQGQLVDHITTGKDGKISTKQLFLGSYEAVETKAPAGIALLEKAIPFQLTYAGQELAISPKALNAQDNKQAVKV